MVSASVEEIISFDIDQAVLAASLKKHTKQFGLSLGDRACIALGIIRKCPIYTADKAWSKLKIKGCDINLIR